MSDLTAKFGALETQLATQAATMGAYVDTVEEKLQALFDEMDLMLINNAVNTRALLQAIGANSPCGCDNPPSLVVPPIGTTPIGISSDQCKRIQAFLHTLQEIVTTLDAVSSFSISLDFTLLNNSINEVITSIESGSDLPVISFPEGVQLVGDTITYVADNLLVGGSLSSYFSSILFDLRDGMTFGTSASSMQGLYNGVVNASSLPSYVKPVLRDAAYLALYSYYFDPGTSPALGGYDGSLCGGLLPDIPSCIVFTSADATFGGHTYSLVFVPPSYGPYPTAIAGDYNGFRFKVITGPTGKNMGLYKFIGGVGPTLLDSFNIDSDEYTISTTTEAILLVGLDYDSERVSFTLRICPPE